MATEEFILEFSAVPTGRASRAPQMLRDARKSLKDTFKSGIIEQTILDNIIERLTEPRKQRDPDTGKAWPKLDKTTVGRRRSNIDTGRVKLVDTGSMRAALKIKKKGLKKTTDTRTGISEIGFKNVNSASSGVSIDEVAADHHSGREYPNGRILPARPFMGVSKKEGTAIAKLFKLRFDADLIQYEF
jgi:hypothetical protein